MCVGAFTHFSGRPLYGRAGLSAQALPPILAAVFGAYDTFSLIYTYRRLCAKRDAEQGKRLSAELADVGRASD